MPSVSTTGSSNIATLDSKIYANLCDGKFYVDITPSVWIDSGNENVLGANVQITNPYGVVVKPYGPDYEIAPGLSGGMDTIINFNIPTLAGNYQYGQYTVDVELFDADGKSWVVSKTVKICEPDQRYKSRNYGSLSAALRGSCKDGKLYVIVDGIPNYNGKTVSSQTQSFELEYPTSSGLDPLVTTYGSYAVQLYEGVYKITGEICATYSYGDNVYARVKYKVKKEKSIRCLIDRCCVFAQLEELNARIKTNCSDEEKNEVASITVDALRLLTTIELAAECGEDASGYITDLEKLLGCSCTCNCADGTPIINNSPSTDFLIEGCNVDYTQVGLTKTYTINNYEYKVSVVDNGGVLVAATATLNGCTKTQQLTFSIANAYTQIKSLANENNTEADFWASVINKGIRDVDPSCLGISVGTWQAYTLKQKIDKIVERLCATAGCSASVSAITTETDGSDVYVQWTNEAGTYAVDIYLDGVFVGSVLSPVNDFKFSNATSGSEKTYVLIPKCSNGNFGTPSTGTFFHLGCPDVAPPSLATTLYQSVDCPFDLEAALGLTPGTYEIHNQNNTLAASIVGNPTAVNDGVYYVFNRVASGLGYCYSIGVQVTVLCDQAASCTAPQNLQEFFELNELSSTIKYFSFASAAYPPPGNSYTAKRRKASDPDVPGSYTTLGTPIYNSEIDRWQFSDTISAAEKNIMYVYRVESNCGGSPATTPYVDLNFAKFKCDHAITPTPTENTIAYSIPTGTTEDIDKFEVELWQGGDLIHTDTFTPAFSDPITGTFLYLDPSTTYTIKLRVCIGSYCKSYCNTINSTTLDPS